MEGRYTPLSTLSAWPATSLQPFGMLARTGTTQLAVAAEGGAAGVVSGAQTLTVGGATDPWVLSLTLTDLTGGAGIQITGTLLDGEGDPVKNAVIEGLCSTLALGAVTIAAATGTVRSQRPGYDAGGGAACGLAFSVESDGAGVFDFTLTSGAGADTLYLFLSYLSLQTQQTAVAT